MVPILAAIPDWLVGLLGSVSSGGLLGIFGGIATTWMSIWQSREVRAAKREEALARLEELKVTSQMNKEQAAAALELAKEQGAARAFEASINADANATGVSDKVQDIKAMVRPLILAYLAVSTLVYFICSFFVEGGREIAMWIVQMNVTLFFTVVSWYFGQRWAGQNVLQVMQSGKQQ